MMRFPIALLGLGAAAALLVAACSSSESATQSNVAPNGGYWGSPTSEVMGVQGTPVPTGTVSPAAIQRTLNEMDRFAQWLSTQAQGTPGAADVVFMTRHASGLMADVHTEIGQMSAQQQTQALNRMSYIVGEMAQVLEAYVRQLQAAGTPVAQTPMPTMAGGVSAMAGTPTATAVLPVVPTAGPVSAAQLSSEIDQIRRDAMAAAADQPTYEVINNLLLRMQAVLQSMAQQPSQLSASDMEALTGDMAQAMNDMVQVVQVYVVQVTGSVPATTTPIPTPVP